MEVLRSSPWYPVPGWAAMDQSCARQGRFGLDMSKCFLTEKRVVKPWSSFPDGMVDVPCWLLLKRPLNNALKTML